MCNGIKILCCVEAMYPQTFLTCLLKSWVVTFGFGSECVNLLERNTLTINEKSVIIRECNIFCVAPVFSAIVPVLVIAWTGSTFWVFQRTAIFLTCPAIVRKLSVLVHSKTSLANRVTASKLLWIFGVTLVKRNNTFSVIKLFYSIVNSFDIVAFVG